MPKRKYQITEILKKQIVEEYVKSTGRKVASTIANKYGIPDSYIFTFLREAGIKKRKQRITTPAINKIKTLVNQGLNFTEIAKLLGCSRQAVRVAYLKFKAKQHDK